MRPRIVISGVNLVDMGPLSVYRDALRSLVQACAGSYEVVALVHREELLGISGITYLEFPNIKGSWLRRLRFEYFDSLRLSQQLKPKLWVAMHDMTPRLRATRQVVYCHNPAPFYRFSLREAALDPIFGLHTLFYRFLYKILLQRNSAIIVQQDWIRNEFRRRYHARNVIVANPNVEIEDEAHAELSSSRAAGAPYRFFYPAFPRPFKNHELLLKAIHLLEQQGVSGFEVTLTVNAESNRVGAALFRRFASLRSVRWVGSISRDRVDALYRESNCLLFPSRLETWGMPLMEFKATGKPILAVGLPYARETIGSYDRVAFFDADDETDLARQMELAIRGSMVWSSVRSACVDEPFAKNWQALWKMLLELSESDRLVGQPTAAFPVTGAW